MQRETSLETCDLNKYSQSSVIRDTCNSHNHRDASADGHSDSTSRRESSQQRSDGILETVVFVPIPRSGGVALFRGLVIALGASIVGYGDE